MKVIKTITATISDIIIILLFLIFVLFMFSKFVNKDRMPNIFGYSLLRIVSGSMESKYHVGDYIIIKKQDNYKVDDVVTYIDDNDNFVTHRIIKIDDTEVTTKGDANNIEDEIFDIVNIQGKVVYKLPHIFSMLNAVTILIIIGTIIVMRIIINKFLLSD